MPPIVKDEMRSFENLVLLIEKRLSEIVSGSGKIQEAARYSLLGGGKRFRPLLVMASTSALKADPSLAIDPACSLEMVHTYSLIHDDLPCMDNDDFRWKKPTSHKVFGEGVATLAGDFLLTAAFEVLSKAPTLSAEQKISLVEVLSKRAGAKGMIGGQVTDILAAGSIMDKEEFLEMYRGKTAALFLACFEFAAIIARKDPADFYELGLELGLAYQFQNDLLDATSSFEAFGKEIGRDLALEKPTAVTFFGVIGLQSELDLLARSIQKRLRVLFPEEARLCSLVERMFKVPPVVSV